MGLLSKIAQNISGFDGIYISIDKIIATYPEGVTVIGAFSVNRKDKKTGEIRPFGCFRFAESDKEYFYAEAGDLKKIYNEWLKTCNGNIDELNERLNEENVKLKIFKKKKTDGNSYTKALVLDVFEKTPAENIEKIDFETGEILSDSAPF